MALNDLVQQALMKYGVTPVSPLRSAVATGCPPIELFTTDEHTPQYLALQTGGDIGRDVTTGLMTGAGSAASIVLALLITLVATGCSTIQPESFTLLTELPPGFSLKGEASYSPRKEETCAVPPSEGRSFPGLKFFEQEFSKDAQTASFEVPLTSNVGECPLMLSRFSFELQGKFGTDRLDIGRDYAGISIQDKVTDSPSTSVASGPKVLQNQCQWLFRTAGPDRYIVKILKCRTANENGQMLHSGAGGVLQRDQLAGNTVKMVFTMAVEEQPAVGDNWVKFPSGWKRCMGNSLEDPYAFCRGNTTDFKPFKMPDGRDCTVYPRCIE